MSEHEPTMEDLEGEMTRNLDRKRESEGRNEVELAGLFEARMNRALDQYGDILKFMGQAVILGASEAA